MPLETKNPFEQPSRKIDLKERLAAKRLEAAKKGSQENLPLDDAKTEMREMETPDAKELAEQKLIDLKERLAKMRWKAKKENETRPPEE